MDDLIAVRIGHHGGAVETIGGCQLVAVAPCLLAGGRAVGAYRTLGDYADGSVICGNGRVLVAHVSAQRQIDAQQFSVVSRRGSAVIGEPVNQSIGKIHLTGQTHGTAVLLKIGLLEIGANREIHPLDPGALVVAAGIFADPVFVIRIVGQIGNHIPHVAAQRVKLSIDCSGRSVAVHGDHVSIAVPAQKGRNAAVISPDLGPIFQCDHRMDKVCDVNGHPACIDGISMKLQVNASCGR